MHSSIIVNISRQIAAVSTRFLPACRSSPRRVARESGPAGLGRRRFASAVYLATHCNHARISITSPELSNASSPGFEISCVRSSAKAHFRPGTRAWLGRPWAQPVGLISQQRASDIAEIQTPGIWPSHAHAHQAKKYLSYSTNTLSNLI